MLCIVNCSVHCSTHFIHENYNIHLHHQYMQLPVNLSSLHVFSHMTCSSISPKLIIAYLSYFIIIIFNSPMERVLYIIIVTVHYYYNLSAMNMYYT